MNEIINFSSLTTLSEEEQKGLLIKAKNGDVKAKEEFIKSYLIIIKEFIEICSFGINNSDDNVFSQLYDDMFQEGVLSLMKAYEKYDFNRSSLIDFYFRKCIYRGIHRYLVRNSKSFSIPIATLEKFNSVYEFIDKATLKNETYPSVEEIALGTNIRRETVEEAISNSYPSIRFDDIEDTFISTDKNKDEFLEVEDNCSVAKILKEALLRNYLDIYTEEELKDIYNFGRLYQLKIRNKISKNELLELDASKQKILLKDNWLMDEQAIYDKYEQVYLSLRRTHVIIKRVICSPNEQWLQNVLGEYYGVDYRMIGQIEKSTLKKIKKYIKKNNIV